MRRTDYSGTSSATSTYGPRGNAAPCLPEVYRLCLPNHQPKRVAGDAIVANALVSVPEPWYKNTDSITVGENTRHFNGVFFHPADGLGVGVSMSQALSRSGIALPNDIVQNSFPKEWRNQKGGMLVIKWPGYEHIEFQRPIGFIYSGIPNRIVHLASSVACHFHSFIQSHWREFNGNGVRLGPYGVTLDHLRLHQIYCSDAGYTWHAEVSYTPPSHSTSGY